MITKTKSLRGKPVLFTSQPMESVATDQELEGRLGLRPVAHRHLASRH